MANKSDDVLRVYPVDDDLTADNVLTYALGKLENVLIVGRTDDGHSYYAATTGDLYKLVYELERAKLFFMHQAENEEDEDA